MQPAKFLGIQYLRGIAALMVAYLHLLEQFDAYRSMLSGPSWIRVSNFSAGVDIFFLISGFIMVATSRKLDPGTFLYRRLIRIIPLYWVLTALLTTAALIAPSLFRETAPDAGSFLKSLFFIAFHNNAQHGNIFPLLVPGWTLNLEMCFYLVFALTLWSPIRKYQVWIVGAILLSDFLIGTAIHPAYNSLWWFYTRPLILEFWIGMLIAHLAVTRTPPMSGPASLLLASAGILYAITPLSTAIGGSLMFMAGPVLCVIGVVWADRRNFMPKLSPLELLGDASYSIYLTHIFTFGATRELWLRFRLVHDGSAISAFCYAIFSLLSVVAVALVTYHYIEKPSLKFLRQLLERMRSPGSSRK